MVRKRKTIWAYINGKRKYDVVKLALSESIMVEEMKKRLKAQFQTLYSRWNRGDLIG